MTSPISEGGRGGGGGGRDSRGRSHKRWQPGQGGGGGGEEPKEGGKREKQGNLQLRNGRWEPKQQQQQQLKTKKTKKKKINATLLPNLELKNGENATEIRWKPAAIFFHFFHRVMAIPFSIFLIQDDGIITTFDMEFHF